MNQMTWAWVMTITNPPQSDIRAADEIARTPKPDRPLASLVRLLARVHLLYEPLTGMIRGANSADCPQARQKCGRK